MKTLLMFIALVLLLAGCATGPATGPATEPDPEEIERDIIVPPRDPDDSEQDSDSEDDEVTDPRELPSYEVVRYSSGDFSDEESVELTSYSRARVFASILEALELAEEMSDEQRRDLHDAIFRSVPGSGSGTFRAVAVSDYFSSGEPLYLLLGVDNPTDAAPDDTVQTLLIQSSVLRDGERIATRSYGRLVDMTVNISWVYQLGDDGHVREIAAAYTPRLAERTLDDEMPHEAAREASGEDEGEGEGDEITLGDLLDTGAAIESPRVVPREFEEDPPPVIDVGERFTAETRAALERGAEPSEIPQAPAERVRLANRLVESAARTDSLNVPMLVDSLIDDESIGDTVRLEAAFVRLLEAMMHEGESAVARHARRLESVREEASSIPSKLAYRTDTIVPIMLEAYRYETDDL